MKNSISILAFVTCLFFYGCASNNSIAYDSQNHKKIKQVLTGKITHTRDVYIKDDGSGALVGTVIGTVLGSTVGKGEGSTLTALGGGVLGGVIGNEFNKVNAQELTVSLTDGKTIVVLSKKTNFNIGDNIKIITVENEVSSVYKI